MLLCFEMSAFISNLFVLLVLCSGLTKWDEKDGLDDALVQSSSNEDQIAHGRIEPISDTEAKNVISSLDLLASAYGASSDSEDEAVQPEMVVCPVDVDIVDSSLACKENLESRSGTSTFISLNGGTQDGETKLNSTNFLSLFDTPCCISNGAIIGNFIEKELGSIDASGKNRNMLHLQSSDIDSFRMHIFCLEHAVEVENQLRSMGGAHIMLLCNSGELWYDLCI